MHALPRLCSHRSVRLRLWTPACFERYNGHTRGLCQVNVRLVTLSRMALLQDFSFKGHCFTTFGYTLRNRASLEGVSVVPCWLPLHP